jgi:hypothetical protein
MAMRNSQFSITTTMAVTGVSASWLLRFFFSAGADPSRPAQEWDVLEGCGRWAHFYLQGAFGQQSVAELMRAGESRHASERAVIAFREESMRRPYTQAKKRREDKAAGKYVPPALVQRPSASHDSVTTHNRAWLEQRRKAGAAASIGELEAPLRPAMSSAQVVEEMIRPATEWHWLEYVAVFPAAAALSPAPAIAPAAACTAATACAAQPPTAAIPPAGAAPSPRQRGRAHATGGADTAAQEGGRADSATTAGRQAAVAAARVTVGKTYSGAATHFVSVRAPCHLS